MTKEDRAHFQSELESAIENLAEAERTVKMWRDRVNELSGKSSR